MFKFSIPKEVRLAPRIVSLLRACREGVVADSELAKSGLTPFKGQVHGYKSVDVFKADSGWVLRVSAVDGETEDFTLSDSGDGLYNEDAEGVLRDELDCEPPRRLAHAKAAEAKAATDAAFKAAAELERRSAARRARFDKPLSERFFGEHPKRRRW